MRARIGTAAGSGLGGRRGSRARTAAADFAGRWLLAACALLWLATAPVAAAPGGGGGGNTETVDISVPGSVTFTVIDATTSTRGAPSPSTVSYVNASLRGNNRLRISVRAEAPEFSNPGGPVSIPASSVSWTAGTATGGTGYSGTLSTAYVPVYESTTKPSSGGVDLTWTLAAPPALCHAGIYSLTLRWLVEAF